jgi:hypothetical protein
MRCAATTGQAAEGDGEPGDGAAQEHDTKA